KKHPNDLSLWNILGFCQQALGDYKAAIASFKRVVEFNNKIPEIYFNLAALYTQLNKNEQAIENYKKVIQLKPNFVMAHFNLAAIYQAQNQLPNAVLHYQQALAYQPNFVEALANLGTVLQLQGHNQAAKHCYQQALQYRNDAQIQFNLGTVFHDLGEHESAIKAFEMALELNPTLADAWNNLGETLRDKGEMNKAVECYQQALQTDPQHDRALYNLGEYYCLANQLLEAIPYFEASLFADAKERALQCLYKTRQFEVFKQKFDELKQSKAHSSVLLGTLSTHYAINFNQENDYSFCPDPMDYVLHTRIDELAIPNSELLKQLLDDIQHLAIAERKQGRLYYGIQSAGNLLQRSETSFQTLAALIRAKVQEYQQHFADSHCQLIQQFPNTLEFSSSWYLRMKKGGHLTSHIHEEGWISGCVYLQLPDKNGASEGSFEYGTDGDEYPRLHDNFPIQIVDQHVGDLVLFPSSLFHRTLPFHSNQERICVAFDIKPK
ncbi:partial TPR repeat-containing protein YrrB, partial [Patescibacteria group bacterium]